MDGMITIKQARNRTTYAILKELDSTIRSCSDHGACMANIRIDKPISETIKRDLIKILKDQGWDPEITEDDDEKTYEYLNVYW